MTIMMFITIDDDDHNGRDDDVFLAGWVSFETITVYMVCVINGF